MGLRAIEWSIFEPKKRQDSMTLDVLGHLHYRPVVLCPTGMACMATRDYCSWPLMAINHCTLYSIQTMQQAIRIDSLPPIHATGSLHPQCYGACHRLQRVVHLNIPKGRRQTYCAVPGISCPEGLGLPYAQHNMSTATDHAATERPATQQW